MPRFPVRGPYIFFRFEDGYSIYMRPGKRTREALESFREAVGSVAARCDEHIKAGVPANRVTAAGIREARTARGALVRWRLDAFTETAISGFPDQTMTELSRYASGLLAGGK